MKIKEEIQVSKKKKENHKKSISNARGITLIALVVTIIILLILASVSINLTTGDNGLFKKAEEAVDIYKKSQEDEALKTYMAEMIIDKELNKEEQIGIELYDKTVENGSKWNIVTIKENNKVYGTGWSLIEKGTELKGYGKLDKSWLINKNTGETVELEEDTYINLNYASSLGVTNGLIFNLDSAIIDKNTTKEDFEKQLGANVELANFNWNENSGINNGIFKLDGEDDYIKVAYGKDTEKQTIAQNGYTFEFMGKLDKGKAYLKTGEEYDCDFSGIFQFSKSDWKNSAYNLRFFIRKDIECLVWTAGYASAVSDWSRPGDHSKYDICFPITMEELLNKDIAFTITLDTSTTIERDSQEYYRQTLYVNGEKRYDGLYNKLQWTDYINNRLPNASHFIVGAYRGAVGADECVFYSKMEAKALRLYNRGLSEEEVKNNYNKSLAYYNIIKK